MEKNHIIGFVLIFATLFVWSYLNKPSEEELARHKRMQDSIANIQIAADNLDEVAAAETMTQLPAVKLPDSVQLIQNARIYGPMATASVGTARAYTLENDKVKVTFSSKGGKVTSVELKEYTKKLYKRDEETREEQVVLLGDERNKFEYLLPIASAPSGFVSTEDLYFEASQSGNTITFTAKASTGGSFTQKYTLDEGYNLDYDIDYAGLDKVFNAKANTIGFNWENYLHDYERNATFEQQYSAVYYKEHEESDPDDCGCMQDDKVVIDEEKLDWVSHSNQYFNSSLIAMTAPFESGVVESVKN